MNETPEIEKGMVVRLKSGGPPLVVRSVTTNEAYCEWFTETERRQGTFLLKTLEVVEAAPPSATA
ncbi:MAG TPA: DUF2158 domain-containing protein [Ramlibacter sp.]|uniref:DUF2158 domain-containing protein n=1 Tax=Ramlibacter sp. TaxID=1917967 RepID=UPI002ED0F327